MKKHLILLLIFMFPAIAFAVQDTIYLNWQYETVSESDVSIFHVVNYDSDSSYLAYTDYTKTMVLKESGYVLRDSLMQRNGIVTSYHKNGEKSSQAVYIEGEFDDYLKQWSEEGVEQTIVYPFVRVEVKPEYPGGEKAMLKFLAYNTSYPEIAKENGIQGKVFIQFVIGADGKVSDVKVVRGVDDVLDKEAVRVLSKLNGWLPGEHKGMKVPVMNIVPINFKLY